MQLAKIPVARGAVNVYAGKGDPLILAEAELLHVIARRNAPQDEASQRVWFQAVANAVAHVQSLKTGENWTCDRSIIEAAFNEGRLAGFATTRRHLAERGELEGLLIRMGRTPEEAAKMASESLRKGA